MKFCLLSALLGIKIFQFGKEGEFEFTDSEVAVCEAPKLVVKLQKESLQNMKVACSSQNVLILAAIYTVHVNIGVL